MKNRKLIQEIKHKLEIISETKCNHLILADTNEYHRHRYIVEKEKEDLLEEILELLYNESVDDSKKG